MAQNAYEHILAVKEQVEGDLLKIPGVHGVSIGRKTVNGQKTDELAIVVHLTYKIPADQDDCLKRMIDW
jgi:hypothetical protein